MKKKFPNIGGSITLLFFLAAMVVPIVAGPVGASDSFERAGLRFEQNFTDRDVEVVFDVVTKTVGLAALQVTAPGGRIVIDFKSPGSRFGMRHLTLETPEPINDGKIQADFPEGVYRFNGTTTKGEKIRATATLSHELPPVPQPISPRPGQDDVPIAGVKVAWKPMPGIAQFIVILEDEKSGQDNTATVPGTKNVFIVPPGFFTYGGTYKVEIGAVAGNGNRTFMEYEISTAKRP